MANDIHLRSRAMWGTSCYHGPSRTLFDCGLGCLDMLGSRIFAIRTVFLSHGRLLPRG